MSPSADVGELSNMADTKAKSEACIEVPRMVLNVIIGRSVPPVMRRYCACRSRVPWLQKLMGIVQGTPSVALGSDRMSDHFPIVAWSGYLAQAPVAGAPQSREMVIAEMFDCVDHGAGGSSRVANAFMIRRPPVANRRHSP